MGMAANIGTYYQLPDDNHVDAQARADMSVTAVGAGGSAVANAGDRVARRGSALGDAGGRGARPRTAMPTAMPFIAMYHSVEPYRHDPYLVTVRPERFEQQLDWLSGRGLRGVSMSDLLAAGAGRSRRPGKLVGLTFDDGYADFVYYALPALRRHGFGATLYVIAGRLGGKNTWDTEGPRKALLTPGQLRQVAEAGIEIGSHGMTHVSLPAVPDAALADETLRSRRMLQEITGQEVPGFCYPYGDIDRRVLESVRGAGYGYACAISASSLTGRHALPRTYVGDADFPLRMRAKWIRHRMKWSLPRVIAAAAKTSLQPHGSPGDGPAVGRSA